MGPQAVVGVHRISRFALRSMRGGGATDVQDSRKMWETAFCHILFA